MIQTQSDRASSHSSDLNSGSVFMTYRVQAVAGFGSTMRSQRRSTSVGTPLRKRCSHPPKLSWRNSASRTSSLHGLWWSACASRCQRGCLVSNKRALCRR